MRVLKLIEVKTLEEGSYIPAELIETASGVERTHVQYGRIVQRVKESLEAMLARMGRDVMLRSVEGGLRVLTNEEAADYGWSQADLGITKTDRWFHKTLLCVKPKLLSNKQREHHDRKRDEIGRLLLHHKENQIRGMTDDGLPGETT